MSRGHLSQHLSADIIAYTEFFCNIHFLTFIFRFVATKRHCTHLCNAFVLFIFCRVFAEIATQFFIGAAVLHTIKQCLGGFCCIQIAERFAHLPHGG